MKKPELIELYIKIGNDYKLPVMLSKNILNDDLQKTIDERLNKFESLLDNVFIVTSEQYFAIGLENYYKSVLQSLPAGLSLLGIHCLR